MIKSESIVVMVISLLVGFTVGQSIKSKHYKNCLEAVQTERRIARSAMDLLHVIYIDDVDRWWDVMSEGDELMELNVSLGGDWGDFFDEPKKELKQYTQIPVYGNYIPLGK